MTIQEVRRLRKIMHDTSNRFSLAYQELSSVLETIERLSLDLRECDQDVPDVIMQRDKFLNSLCSLGYTRSLEIFEKAEFRRLNDDIGLHFSTIKVKIDEYIQDLVNDRKLWLPSFRTYFEEDINTITICDSNPMRNLLSINCKE